MTSPEPMSTEEEIRYVTILKLQVEFMDKVHEEMRTFLNFVADVEAEAYVNRDVNSWLAEFGQQLVEVYGEGVDPSEADNIALNKALSPDGQFKRHTTGFFDVNGDRIGTIGEMPDA